MKRFSQRTFNLLSISVIVILLLVGCVGGGGSDKSPPPISSAVASSSISISQPLGVAADNAINALMTTSGVSAVTFAVAKNGQIIYEKAYGFEDAAHTVSLTTDALMRTGSIIKPVTAAAIRTLANNGSLSLSDHVFCTGNNAPCWLSANFLSANTDARVKNITIQHLISHEGGWLISMSGDAAYLESDIKNTLNINRPPTQAEIIKYYMARPLGYTPGSSADSSFDNFSNFGFMVLGYIVELAAQKSYVEFVQTNIMAQLGVASSEFKAGASRLVDRDIREPAYNTTAQCKSVFTDTQAICAEEMREVTNWLSICCSITTARVMALFAQHYRLSTREYGLHDSDTGTPLVNYPAQETQFNGDMEGLTTVVKQFPSGVSYAILLNQTLIFSQADFNYYSTFLDAISQSAL